MTNLKKYFHKPEMKNITKGFLAVILSQLCLAIIEVVSIFGYRTGMNSYTLTTFRMLEVMILVGLTIFFSKRLSFKIKKRDILRVLACSLFLALDVLVFWRGLEVIGNIGILLSIDYTFPIIVAVLAMILFRESMTIKKVLSMVLGFLGVLFAIQFLPYGNYTGVSVLGFFFASMAALLWAFYFLALQPLLKKYNRLTILFYNFAITFLIFLFLQNPIVSFTQLTWRGLGYISIVAIVSTYLSYFLFLEGIKRIGAARSSILCWIKPPISIGLAFLLLHQVFTGWQSLGIALVIAGGITLSIDKKNGKKQSIKIK